MILDPIAQALHQKSVLGGVLSVDERARLDKWYAENDTEEIAMFERAREERLSKLEKRVDEITARIVAETAVSGSTELTELLPAVRGLCHLDKLRLMQYLAGVIGQDAEEP